MKITNETVCIASLDPPTLTARQQILKDRHGLPHEFAAAVYGALGDISLAEAQAAIRQYTEEFYRCGHTDPPH